MMHNNDRRALLQMMSGAALLAPLLPVSATEAAEASSHNPAHSDHMAMMKAALGDGMHGNEKIAMLLYPGFTALDLVGPHYYFASMLGAQVHLVTTEANLSPVPSDLGLAIKPTIRMADVPAVLDVLFVPGGTEGTVAVMKRADVMRWVKSRAARAKHVTSVCTGAMILAKAGVLRGRRATSHWVTRDLLAHYGAIPVDERVVIDGPVLTGAGVSAGIDFALTLVAKLRGRAYAEALVLQSEYAPQPPINGGRIENTSKPVADMMQDFFAPVKEQFKAAAR